MDDEMMSQEIVIEEHKKEFSRLSRLNPNKLLKELDLLNKENEARLSRGYGIPSRNNWTRSVINQLLEEKTK